jgi:hypothetical protein
MPCCGNKRAQARQTTQTRQVPKPAKTTSWQRRPERDSPAYFQYLGKRGLTVMGPKTRKVYRFDSPGAVVAVDPKDWRALSAVSALKQVRKPTNVAKEF